MDEIDEKFSLVQPVNSPWLDCLLQSIAQVKQQLLIVSPFIKKEAISSIEEMLRKNAEARLEPLSVRVITCTRENDFLTGASDIEALCRLLQWPEIVLNTGVEMRSIENLHAKLWVVDTHLAIVGSANATGPGLQHNLEYGLLVTDSRIVEGILEDWLHWWNKGNPVNQEQLDEMHQWLYNMKNHDLWQEIEEIARGRRKALEEKMGKPPRIGKRVPLPREKKGSPFRASEPPLPVTGEEQAAQKTEEFPNTLILSEPIRPSEIHQLSLFERPEDATKTSAETSVQAFMVSAFSFEQALRWVCPIIYRSGEEPTDGTFSFQCLPETSQVYLTWFDGTRLSRAALTCLTMTVKTKKLFSCNWNGVRSISEKLVNINIARMKSYPYKDFNLLFSIDEAAGNLTIKSLERDAERKESNVSSLVSVSASPLKPPVTDFSVKASSLGRALGRMERVWRRRFPTEEFPDSVEGRLEPHGETSALKLRVGSLEKPQEKTVRVENQRGPSPIGPIRWNLLTLREVLTSHQQPITRDAVSRTWQVSMSSDADFVVFVPKWNDGVQWYHMLKSEEDQDDPSIENI